MSTFRGPFKKKLDERISGLARDPRPPGARALQGQWKGMYRVRLGVFRVIYQIQDDRLVITIIRIADRRDAYDLP